MVLGMTISDMGFLSLALFFNTFTAPAVKITQSEDGTYNYNKYCIYFVAEMIKFSVAAGWSVWKWQTEPEMRKVMKITKRDIAQ